MPFRGAHASGVSFSASRRKPVPQIFRPAFPKLKCVPHRSVAPPHNSRSVWTAAASAPLSARPEIFRHAQVSRPHNSAAKAGALQRLRAIRCQKKSRVHWFSIPPATRPPVAPGLSGGMWMQANCPNRSRFVAVPGLPEFGCLKNGKPHTGKGAEK